jgi:alginate O-acetyltransferase complex protein AlgI
MNFTNVTFLFYALPLICTLYYALRDRAGRNFLLLISSLIFYAWGEGIYLGLLLGSIIVNRGLAQFISQSDTAETRERGGVPKARLWLFFGLGVNLGFLVAFKYLGLLTASLTGLGVPEFALHLPLGISFFTFQAMSLLVDVSRGADPPKSILKTGLYISMFPQLIAGPIVRFNEIQLQIDGRQESWSLFRAGLFLFILGLAQKLLIADTLAPTVEAAFSAAPQGQGSGSGTNPNHSPSGGLSMGAAWLGLLCFSLQIFYDFAGYSNMAIGLGKVFGFRFPQNFNYPYSAKSFREFWRRWHMTLSRWFRDYLYIPLGGSRGGARATYRNLFIVFVLCGLWHGAAWTFLFWGLWHGAFLTAERWLAPHFKGLSIPPLLGMIYVWLFVSLGWVLFRADSLPDALSYYGALFGLKETENVIAYKAAISPSAAIALIAGILFIWEGWERRLWPAVKSKLAARAGHEDPATAALLHGAALCLLTGLCFAVLSAQTHQAFLYFKF